MNAERKGWGKIFPRTVSRVARRHPIIREPGGCPLSKRAPKQKMVREQTVTTAGTEPTGIPMERQLISEALGGKRRAKFVQLIEA